MNDIYSYVSGQLFVTNSLKLGFVGSSRRPVLLSSTDFYFMSSVFKTERIFAASSSVIDLGKRYVSFGRCAFHQGNGVLALFQIGNAQVQDISKSRQIPCPCCIGTSTLRNTQHDLAQQSQGGA